jgi:hypothetical protein
VSEVSPEVLTVQPFEELPAHERLDAAVLSFLRGRGRRADGTAGPGNTLALKHGLKSERLLEDSTLAAVHREMVEALTNDLGGGDALSAMEAPHVREYARLGLIAESLGHNVLERGALTGKGKTRAAVNVYLQVLDRLVRLGQTLGLKRRTKRASSLAELADQMAQHQSPTATANEEEQQHAEDSDSRDAGGSTGPSEEAARAVEESPR